jgi:hypothetical protein
VGFKRPFWAHQALEYVLALALLSHVLRVDDGLWPRLLAAVVVGIGAMLAALIPITQWEPRVARRSRRTG